MSEKSLPTEISWLKGRIDRKYSREEKQYLQRARRYFENIDEKLIKKCWGEFESILNNFIKKFGENCHSMNQFVIIRNKLSLLANYEPFTVFISKWTLTMQKVKHPFMNDSKQITWNTILSALFILKHFSIGDIYAVSDMGSFLSSDEEFDFRLLSMFYENVQVEKKKKQKAATSKRNSFNTLLKNILQEDSSLHYRAAWKKIKNLSADEKEQYRIKSVDDKDIYFYNSKRKPMGQASFKSNLSKARRQVVSKI